jgi:hypothetical protein
MFAKDQYTASSRSKTTQTKHSKQQRQKNKPQNNGLKKIPKLMLILVLKKNNTGGVAENRNNVAVDQKK